jgi:hypothetical protein
MWPLVVGIVAGGLLTAGAWAGNAAGGSVVIGQDAQGRKVMLQVIPLKFMDAAVAAMLFGGVSVNTGNSANALGSSNGNLDRGYVGRGSNQSQPKASSAGSAANQGYNGYADALQRYGAMPGYQSPYARQ